MDTFKVWIQIERIPDGDEDPEDVSEPACLGVFDSEADARAFVDALPGADGDDRSFGY